MEEEAYFLNVIYFLEQLPAKTTSEKNAKLIYPYDLTIKRASRHRRDPRTRERDRENSTEVRVKVDFDTLQTQLAYSVVIRGETISGAEEHIQNVVYIAGLSLKQEDAEKCKLELTPKENGGLDKYKDFLDKKKKELFIAVEIHPTMVSEK